MTRFAIRPKALAELDEAASWYEEQRAGLGGELLDEYRGRLAAALKVPAAGSVVATTPHGTVIRRFRLVRFKHYAIVMAAVKGLPTVIAFEHSSRSPKYWRGRVR